MLSCVSSKLHTWLYKWILSLQKQPVVIISATLACGAWTTSSRSEYKVLRCIHHQDTNANAFTDTSFQIIIYRANWLKKFANIVVYNTQAHDHRNLNAHLIHVAKRSKSHPHHQKLWNDTYCPSIDTRKYVVRSWLSSFCSITNCKAYVSTNPNQNIFVTPPSHLYRTLWFGFFTWCL